VTSHFLHVHDYVIEQKMTSITVSYRESCMSEHMRRKITCDIFFFVYIVHKIRIIGFNFVYFL